MKYRPEIDGLRSIAVMPVVLTHAGIALFSGGFVGVDVFFVISGFLITRILIEEISSGNFYITKFYERRARRIMPALLLVISVSIPFAWFLMLPEFMQNFSQSIFATLIFSNNILLALTSGYWDLESQFKPLLHTWSLGVEEQYYIVFPIIIMMLWKKSNRIIISAIATLMLASLVFAAYGADYFQRQNFYLPFGRAWELLAGSLAALIAPRINRSKKDGYLAAAGLIMILGAVFGYTENTPSPSIWMILPVLGTVLVILFSHVDNITGWLLSRKPLVWIGLISYSLYLWHQPIFAFARIASLNPPTYWIMLILIAFCVILSWLTWRYVERPMRDNRTISSAPFWILTFGVTTVLAAFGLFMHLNRGMPERIFPGGGEGVSEYARYSQRINQYANSKFNPDSTNKILIIGNSFGRDVANVLLEGNLADSKNIVYVPAAPGDFNSQRLPSYLSSLIKEANVIVYAMPVYDSIALIAEQKAILGDRISDTITFGVKHFGYNISPFGRLPLEKRSGAKNKVLDNVILQNDYMAGYYKPGDYVDLIRLLGNDGLHIRIFDDKGMPLSADRLHFTKYGADFVADQIRSKRPDIALRLMAH